MDFPGVEWDIASPDELGFDSDKLRSAVTRAEATEIDWPTDISMIVAQEDPPPYNRRFGPTKPRGPTGGIVVRSGRVAAVWGDPERVDVTFSATKSYLSTCAGLAYDHGLIPHLDTPIYASLPIEAFSSVHNQKITWRHLLQQTSEWSGSLFGIPDTVDHNRSVMQDETGGSQKKGVARLLREPGAFWEYNDVRVNVLAYALLHLFREPLVDVLRRDIMGPIDATNGWDWYPYENAYVDIDGRSLPSVPGGAHWGGGIWISTYDHARFGLLWLNNGVWNGKRLLSDDWVNESLRVCSVNRRYGFMWWLNTAHTAWKNASEGAFAAQGAGGNVVCVVPEFDIVVVTRWSKNPSAIVDGVLEAVR
jgi:CubicO group peptidase (beta-lactamase class C family)|tara:strand:+ start:1676 stop:2764 length:1089 start_codon:yes stop_codon:yes gene_type:complete